MRYSALNGPALALVAVAAAYAVAGTTVEQTPAGTQHEMVLVPAGSFVMGASDEEAERLRRRIVKKVGAPAHDVLLDAYYIDRYEVTNAQYAMCVNAGVCSPPHSDQATYHPAYYGVRTQCFVLIKHQDGHGCRMGSCH
jgi:formylglycine-generating enzyme required for sulfatase activity